MYDGNHYQLMAEYNQWMNENIYTVCARIPDAQRKEDLGAFFKSIHGTLNHILWGDRALWARLVQRPIASTTIGQELYTDFDELWRERSQMDAELQTWTMTLETNWLNSPLKYTSFVDGKTRVIPHRVMVSHLFNHQTHHRGQVTTLIAQLGYDAGITDIPWTPSLDAVIE